MQAGTARLDVGRLGAALASHGAKARRQLADERMLSIDRVS